MEIDIPESWRIHLKQEFEKPYFKDLWCFVEEEYDTHNCFPPRNQIFNAFKSCAFNDVKVVIIGQDPYHDVGQANGLCFSVNEDIKHPPSLVNIYKEIRSEYGTEYPTSGNLLRWANQGILLLNATLSVRAHEAGSHQKKGWETFTNSVIQSVSKHKKNVVFLLWGSYAKKKIKLIDSQKHKILTSGHPSPLSANRGYWFGNENFKDANKWLAKSNKKTIEW
jgi:uracil-DNA glycosylase